MKLTIALVLQLMLLRINLTWTWGFYKYTIQVLEFKALEAEEKVLIDFSRIRIIGRERSLNGTVDILEDMDNNNFQMSVDFLNDPNNNGQWKPMIFAVPYMGICTAMKYFIGTYGKSTLRQGENTNLPFDGKHCPLPIGTYYIKNLLMNSDSWPDIMPYGGLTSNFRYFKHGKPVGGASCVLHIERTLV